LLIGARPRPASANVDLAASLTRCRFGVTTVSRHTSVCDATYANSPLFMTSATTCAETWLGHADQTVASAADQLARARRGEPTTE
jgi:hypothetical protein